jgi:hypothetical protein
LGQNNDRCGNKDSEREEDIFHEGGKYLPEIASPANAIFASSSEKKNGLARVALLPRGGKVECLFPKGHFLMKFC